MKWQNNVGNSKKRANIITVLFAGFEFSLMVVGESGLGKSTLINSLFLTDVLASGGICYRPEKTTEIREHKVWDLILGGIIDA